MDYVSMPSGLVLRAFRRVRGATPAATAVDGILRRRRRDALGCIQAGYEVVAVAEWDGPATITLMANLCRYGEHQLHFVDPSDQQRFEEALTRQYRSQGIKITDGYVDEDPALLQTAPLQAGHGWISKQPASTPGVSHVFFGDVRKLTSKRILDTISMEVGELDLISGGPPCQGYSGAGKQNVMDPRNSLLFDYMRFIVEMQPKAMMMEEVPEIMSMVTPDGDNVVDKAMRILSDGGFGGYDALQKAVSAKAGNMGIIPRRPEAADKKKVKKPANTEAAPDLFGSAA